MKGNFYDSAYKDILDYSVLPTLYQEFEEEPFPFQHGNEPVHKYRFIKKCFSQLIMEEPDWPAQNADLNPIQHIWDELECGLQARSYHPKSVLDLSHAQHSHMSVRFTYIWPFVHL